MHREHDIEQINRNNFRNSLDALARPGSKQKIEPLFGSGLLAMASMLLYAEVSHYYQGKHDFELIRALCGSPVEKKDRADYLFFDSPETHHLSGVKTGNPENPEESATLIFTLDDKHAAPIHIQLSGPGIQRTSDLTFHCSPDFFIALGRINESFPMGIDLFFVTPDNSVYGLPRTTTIEVLG